MPPIPSCDLLVDDLRLSNLIDRRKLAEVVEDFIQRHPKADPTGLAKFLVKQGILTDFQAENLLKGRMQNMVVGPYTLMDTLGAGSMGTVYKARSKNDDHWYAVRILPRRDMWNLRLVRRQIRALEEAASPGVVPFVDVGTSAATHYLVWRLAEGETLDKRVVKHGKLPPALAALCALQAAETLAHCHKHNLVHGLIKPSNLILCPDEQIRLLDFGVGPLLSEGESIVHTQGKANLLTSRLDCASPESIMDPNNQLPAGDQYSLGCTLYFLLTGAYPFPGERLSERIMGHQTKEATRVREVCPDVPAELSAVVDRLLQKKPEARYPTMEEVIVALRPLAAPPAALTAPVPRVAEKNGAAVPTPAPPVPAPARQAPPPPQQAPAPARQAPAPAQQASAPPQQAPAPPQQAPAPPQQAPVTAQQAPAQQAVEPPPKTQSGEPPAGAPATPAPEQSLGIVGTAAVVIVLTLLGWFLATYFKLF